MQKDSVDKSLYLNLPGGTKKSYKQEEKVWREEKSQ